LQLSFIIGKITLCLILLQLLYANATNFNFRDDSIDSSCSSMEFSYVYLPDIWSAFETIYEPLYPVTEGSSSDAEATSKLESDTEVPDKINNEIIDDTTTKNMCSDDKNFK